MWGCGFGLRFISVELHLAGTLIPNPKDQSGHKVSHDDG